MSSMGRTFTAFTDIKSGRRYVADMTEHDLIVVHDLAAAFDSCGVSVNARVIQLPEVAAVSLVKVIPNDAACAECGFRKGEHDRAGSEWDTIKCPGGDDDSRFKLTVHLDEYAMGLPGLELRTSVTRLNGFGPLVPEGSYETWLAQFRAGRFSRD